MNPLDESEESSKARKQKCISCIKMFFVLLGAIFILIVFTAGGSDLTDPDKLVQDYVQYDVGVAVDLVSQNG